MMVYDSDFREIPCAAIDTAYPMLDKGAASPGAFVVPGNVTKITGIRIGLGTISADTIADVQSAVHIYGGGVDLGEGWFVGPNLSTNGAAATSGGSAMSPLMKYKTNIPVHPGGNFNADAYVYGTDSGTAHVILEIEYDGFPGRIVDSDMREVALTAANTPVAVVNRGTGAAGNFTPLGTIGEVIVGMAPTLTGDATAGLLAIATVKLSGAGLGVSGNYDFVANAGSLGPDTDVHGSYAFSLPERYEMPGIPVKKPSQILAEAQMIESTQAGNAIVGLCYISK